MQHRRRFKQTLPFETDLPHGPVRFANEPKSSHPVQSGTPSFREQVRPTSPLIWTSGPAPRITAAEMKDMEAQLEKLRADAAECALIRDLATDPEKRALFTRLAEHLTALSSEVEAAIAAQLTGGE